MENTKVLFISQEITPYLPESEMSVIARNLPQGIQERGREIRTFMPRFGTINERRNQLHEVIRLSGMNLIINDTDHPLIIKVASIQAARMQVYFIDNEDYFSRKATVADDDGTEFPDNDERAIFFARGVLETTKKLRWAPDVVHCQGWFTALAPLLIKKIMNDDPFFANAKVVYTIYDDEFQNPLDPKVIQKIKALGVSEKEIKILEDPTWVSLTKLAINMSDAVIQGSPTINDEVKKYSQDSGKPFLDYKNEDEYIDAYNEFYESL
ncbi:glycogen/starch synthase [Alkalitalea saponilacus]|uniref:starch synthase n=1 Tax=Alkalitalea saponilacus TaxID=889453 RepID=A0A1T5HNL4_9BACT|nr:glycogen/starch synthase [Alkalitalea saponilacus]ASB49353.1 glycogen synthase [Alkalitalea saponilacus]SKC22130.1 starch synthase [Alkalitalea saponilacus]